MRFRIFASAVALLLALPAARAQPERPFPNEARAVESGDLLKGIDSASHQAATPTPAFGERIDAAAGWLAEKISAVLFYDLSKPFIGPDDKPLGLAVLIIFLGSTGVIFTIWTGCLNLRGFKHAVAVTAGRYDDPTHVGEVNHFQALSAALSATLGLGNIAGVAIAVAAGGPGATFWMIVAGLLGMASKFAECTLGQKYREVRPDGRILGGPMAYLSKGLKRLGLGPVGSFLAVAFCVLCIGGSLGGGNAFQVSQSLNAVDRQLTFLEHHSWIYGLVLAFLVGLVILGGIKRIALVAEKVVPFMCALYVAICLFILLRHAAELPAAVATIVRGAFQPEAAYGGFAGVLVLGFRRAFFSNEAGIGSAAIAHSAAKTEYPVREGVVALLEPFIDTVVVCTMTALVIVVSGVYASTEPAVRDLIDTNQGAALTAVAMGNEVSWFPYVLSVAVFLFAYATLISWFYYGERSWAYLFGDRSTVIYKLIYLVCTFLGSVVSATHILDLSDLMLLSMAVPNVIGLVLLGPEVRRDLTAYWTLYKAGAFEPAAPEKTL